MLYEANIYQMKVEEHTFWVAESKVLKGCVGQGNSSDEAIKELEENEKEWINTARKFNIPIPPNSVKREKNYSGKITLRMSPYIHKRASEYAETLDISLNQYINDALSEYNEKIYHSFNDSSHNQSLVTSKIIDFNYTKSKPVSIITQFNDVEEK